MSVKKGVTQNQKMENESPWHAVKKKSTLSPKFMTFIQTILIFLSIDEKMNIANYTVN